MKRKIFLVLLLTLIAVGCSAKLTTVRPGDVYIVMERISDAKVIDRPYTAKQVKISRSLVLQLEDPYTAVGDCSHRDGHKYFVPFLHTELSSFM